MNTTGIQYNTRRHRRLALLPGPEGAIFQPHPPAQLCRRPRAWLWGGLGAPGTPGGTGPRAAAGCAAATAAAVALTPHPAAPSRRRGLPAPQPGGGGGCERRTRRRRGAARRRRREAALRPRRSRRPATFPGVAGCAREQALRGKGPSLGPLRGRPLWPRRLRLGPWIPGRQGRRGLLGTGPGAVLSQTPGTRGSWVAGAAALDVGKRTGVRGEAGGEAVARGTPRPPRPGCPEEVCGAEARVPAAAGVEPSRFNLRVPGSPRGL